jgi:hypothetical protein
MCCCGCALIVLEPGAGFGSWRALFGFGSRRKRGSAMKAKDVTTEHVITVAPDETPGEKNDLPKIKQDSVERKSTEQ